MKHSNALPKTKRPSNILIFNRQNRKNLHSSFSTFGDFFIMFFGTSFEAPPFSSFSELGETIAHSWEEEQRKGPIPHTENLTLNEISTDYLVIA
jgi:hypothetical protein